MATISAVSVPPAADANAADPAAQAVSLAFEQVIGRDPTAVELAYAVQQLQAGVSITAIRAYLATTGYASVALGTVYDAVVGRAVSAVEIASGERYLASGGTLAKLRGYLASSQEAANAVSALYQPVVGRAITQPELASDEAQLANGTATLATLRTALAFSAESATRIQATYTGVLDRAADADELRLSQTALANGTRNFDAQRYDLATGSEALGKLATLYQVELGRPITLAEIGAGQEFLGYAATLSNIRTYLATSTEAAVAFLNAYQTLYGTAATPTALAGGEQSLAAGATLQAATAANHSAVLSTTSTADAVALLRLFQTIFSVPATSTDLAASEAALAGGATLQASAVTNPPATAIVAADYQTLLGTAPSTSELAATQQAFGATPANGDHYAELNILQQAVTAAAAASPEFTSAINAAYQSAIGRPASAVEQAAARSELSLPQAAFYYDSAPPSPVTLAKLTAQIAALGTGAATSGYGPITPQTIAGTPNYVIGLFNNDAIISPSSTASTSNFNPITDILQIESRQVASFAALNLTQVNVNPQIGFTEYTKANLGSGGTLYLDNVQQSSLTPANFRFV